MVCSKRMPFQKNKFCIKYVFCSYVRPLGIFVQLVSRVSSIFHSFELVYET